MILYAANVWVPAMFKLCITKLPNAAQRGFALKLWRAYRTIFLNSALLLAGILPLDLCVCEATALYDAGKVQREIGNREVKRVSSALQSEHIEFKCLVEKEHLDICSNFDIKIFMDSRKIGGKVGVALFACTSASNTQHLNAFFAILMHHLSGRIESGNTDGNQSV